jgi:hypothetical protein
MFNSAAIILALASTTLAFPHRSRLAVDKPKYVKSVPVPNVAFANVLNISSTPRLFLSTFSGNPMINKDGVYYSSDVQRFVSEDEEIVAKIEGKVTWPNTVAKAPASVFGDDGVVTAGGFLVPGKSDGGIWFSFR